MSVKDGNNLNRREERIVRYDVSNSSNGGSVRDCVPIKAQARVH